MTALSSPRTGVLPAGTLARLSELRPGACATIVSVSQDRGDALAHRLGVLGFTEGVGIRVLRRAPLGDPTLFRLCDYEVCLRSAEAALVVVEVDA